MKSFNIMTSSEGAPLPKRVCLRKEELDMLSKEELVEKWLLQDQYINSLKLKTGESENLELVSLRESEEKLKQQQLEATRKENILVMRLTTKEQEMQEYASQIQELKQSALPSLSQLRAALLDPAVNAMFERMRKEVDSLKARLEETQNELSAWKFTPDSNTGKRLMAKCRLLYVENEELGKLISSGRTAKLEGDLALQKNFSEEMKKSQAELDDFLLELDEDVEGMQSTIYLLQQQLKEAKDQLAKLQSEKTQQTSVAVSPGTTVPYSQNGMQHISKRTDGPPSPASPPSAAATPPSSTVPSAPVHLPHKEASPSPSPTIPPSVVVKDKYLNGDEPVNSPGTPVREVYDEPSEIDLRTEEDSLRPNHRHKRSPEQTPAQPEPSECAERTRSPVLSSQHGPSVTNGKCSSVPFKNAPSEVVTEEVPSDDSSMEVDVTSTSSPPSSSSNLVSATCLKDSNTIIIVQNSEVQDEAVNLTVSSRDMTPPSSTPTCSEVPLKQTIQMPKESGSSSPRPFGTEQFESASRVDIDDDTEVQVAQTLACWAATAKKSETHQASTRYLGNGEIEDTSSVSEGDL